MSEQEAFNEWLKHINVSITGTHLTIAQAIISLVATAYNVDSSTAQRWLEQSFGELKAA